MKAIIDFLGKIGGFFETLISMVMSLFDFIGMLIEGVIWLTGTIPDLAADITALFAYCPPFVGVFLTASFSIIVLYAVFKLI